MLQTIVLTVLKCSAVLLQMTVPALSDHESIMLRTQDAGMVLLHMLRAHAAAYRAIKQLPGMHLTRCVL